MFIKDAVFFPEHRPSCKDGLIKCEYFSINETQNTFSRTRGIEAVTLPTTIFISKIFKSSKCQPSVILSYFNLSFSFSSIIVLDNPTLGSKNHTIWSHPYA